MKIKLLVIALLCALHDATPARASFAELEASTSPSTEILLASTVTAEPITFSDTSLIATSSPSEFLAILPDEAAIPPVEFGPMPKRQGVLLFLVGGAGYLLLRRPRRRYSL